MDLHDVISCSVIGPHHLRLRFDDGLERDLDIAAYVPFDGVFAPLTDPAEFARVRVDTDLGTVAWPNGADLDPVVLYETIKSTPHP